MNDEKRTVDGVPVKKGDRVWFVSYCGPRLRKLDSWDIGFHWEIIGRQIYSSERLALDAAIAADRKSIRRAKQEIARATKAITRFKARLAAAKVSGMPSDGSAP